MLIGYPFDKPQINSLRQFDNFCESTYYHYMYFEYFIDQGYRTFLEYCDNNEAIKAAELLIYYDNANENYSSTIIQLIN